MNARALLFVTTLAALGCARNGSGDLVPTCTAQTPAAVFSGQETYDSLNVENGTLYVEVLGSGLRSCATTGCNDSPTTVFDLDDYVSFTMGPTAITYARQTEIDSSQLDGTSVQTVTANLTAPAFVATSGTRTFWVQDSFAVDETPATVWCLGCTPDGQPTEWIQGIGGASYGLLADASNVYVLEDDPTLTTVRLLACSVQAPCYSEPKLLVDGLDNTVVTAQVASDGTNVYVARAEDIARVDPSGNVTSVVTTPYVTSIAVDAAAGNLYYGTAVGEIDRVTLDAAATNTTLVCGGPDPITALAFDATSLYFLSGPNESDVSKVSK